MSRQSQIDNFFTLKSKGIHDSPKLCQNNMSGEQDKNKNKRKNLSLIKPKTLQKSPKFSKENKNVAAIIDLCSDDENIFETSQKVVNLSQGSNGGASTKSDSSSRTVDYFITPASQQKSPVTPRHSLQLSYTPTRPPHQEQIPKSPKASVSTQSTPKSSTKFFSPVKQRHIVMRKVKRNLSQEMGIGDDCTSKDDKDLQFMNAYVGMDDKTIFFLTTIYKCLSEPSLRHLLSNESITLLESSFHVTKPGMRLVTRLFWRKEGFYRKDLLNSLAKDGNEELCDATVQEMINSLLGLGFIDQGDNMTFDELKTILNREELMQICKELKLKASSKQSAIDTLANFSKKTSNISSFFRGYKSNNSVRVIQMMNSKAGCSYKLSDKARSTLHKLHILMYLGMDYNIIREKRLELTQIYDKINRETYPVDKRMILDNASVVFQSIEEFERYVSAHRINEDYIIRTYVSEKQEIVMNAYNLYKDIDEECMARYQSLPPWLRRYTPAYLYIRMLEEGIKELKKDKCGAHIHLAVDILDTLINQSAFRLHRKAEWYAEKALILHSILHRCDEAAEVLLKGFKSNLSEEAKDSMRSLAKRIAKQKNQNVSEHLKKELLEYSEKEAILEKNLGGEHLYKQPMERSSKRGKVKFETRTLEGRMVQEAEEYCIVHYINSGHFTNGEHWEGRIITTIFFLLFWDIIYTKPSARGVFLSFYQKYPLDLFSESFYQNRKVRIDHWLEVIERATENKLLKIMNDTWTGRPETEVSGIDRSIGWENIRQVIQCVDGRALAAVCRRLAVDYRHAHSGFPDLTLWHTHLRKIKFVEVKTDSDKPSLKQIQWLMYLRQCGIDTGFCYVGVNTTRQRCRKSETIVVETESPIKNKRKYNKRKSKVNVTEEAIEVDKDLNRQNEDDEEILIKNELLTKCEQNNRSDAEESVDNGDIDVKPEPGNASSEKVAADDPDIITQVPIDTVNTESFHINRHLKSNEEGIIYEDLERNQTDAFDEESIAKYTSY